MHIGKIIVSAVLVMQVTQAHSYVCGDKDVEGKKADIVFEGKVKHVEAVYQKDNTIDIFNGRKITFEVTKPIKGKLGKTVTLTTGIFGYSAGYPFLCGSKYIVYAHISDNTIYTNECYPNKPLDDTPDYDALEVILLCQKGTKSQIKKYGNKMWNCQNVNK